MKKQTKEYLEQEKEHLQRVMSDISLDFCNDYNASNDDYLCDAISEFADNNVDIYNADLLEWCKDNYEYVEQAIDEFGDVAKDAHGRADFMRTIQQGQYLYNQNTLYADDDEIVKLLAINYLLDNENEIEIELDNEKIDEMLDDVASYVDQNDTIDTIVDKINEYIKKDDEE